MKIIVLIILVLVFFSCKDAVPKKSPKNEDLTLTDKPVEAGNVRKIVAFVKLELSKIP